ncbi:uncharacterized protein LOC116025234 [Ipomoea triloba]|uniref:uncharacterized protein LOC116025234 n=1 Tax=Ipomoea triloba TaxID=35885 RepID=UPI00125D4701|nr:uncharacterized protein LOC116025234 [Ipomoea triloba]
MNGIQKGKTRNLKEPFPGCLGRMVNLFDLNIGVPGNKLLTENPYQDGFPPRNQSDMASMPPLKDQIADKVIVSKLSGTISNRKSNGTPMKMLIAQEMSRAIDSKHNPPSVVAKLMGLDPLPPQQADSSEQRNYAGGIAGVHADSQLSYCSKRSGSLNTELQHEFQQYSEQNQCKDVYEVRQHPQKNSLRNKSSQKRRFDEKDKRMAFVRQKFIEAKCLSIDEKCRQSNQFQDALEVLSSNTDLFLKFLQEPNPMFSQQISNLQSILPPTEIKRITVLRPSKMVENCKFAGKEKDAEEENRTSLVGQVNKMDENHLDHSPSSASCNIDENSTQPTRIVVLKPSPSRSGNLKAVSSPPCISPGGLHHKSLLENPEDNNAQESREGTTEITQQKHENLVGHQRDEILLSSVFSNGYIGDESSFNKSENEYAMGNLSDSEVLSPASRHSWDFINKFNSPFSCSSLSRASYSPESSVSREAKKRLSERWAMVASIGICQEQRPLRQSSSTLGEMLSLSDAKKSGEPDEGRDKEPKDLNSNPAVDTNKKEGLDSSSRNLLRSKSVPVPSTRFDSQLQVESPEAKMVKTEILQETIKERSIKSSFKGKVSSLFSRNKKPSKQMFGTLECGEESHLGEKYLDPPRKVDDDMSRCLNSNGLECSSPDVHGSSGTTVSSSLPEMHGFISSEVGPGPSVTKYRHSGSPSENQDQPSPISVLGTSFEEDECVTEISLDNIKPYCHGELPVHSIRSNLIDKSPPIGSMARTLSWDYSCEDIATSFSLIPSSMQRTKEEEEKEWFFIVQTILSEAGLDEVQYDSFMSRWHSPESPLDPSLRDKYIVDSHEEETLHEAKRRKRRSTRKLIFDCVNAVLMDIAGHRHDTCQKIVPSVVHSTLLEEGESLILVDHIWEKMREWFSGNMTCLSGYSGDGNSFVVERMVEKELVGKGWIEYWKLEWESIGKEIEGKLLEEIVHEAVFEMTRRM